MTFHDVRQRSGVLCGMGQPWEESCANRSILGGRGCGRPWVDGDGNPLHSGQTNELGVAQKRSGTVVVGVEEGQGLLLKDEEQGVHELPVLVDVVQL